jgi:hypothetical protein
LAVLMKQLIKMVVPFLSLLWLHSTTWPFTVMQVSLEKLLSVPEAEMDVAANQ